jgi:DNA-binding transcriptional regulator GbsR (MarR family)
MKRLEEIREEFIASFEQIAGRFGQNRAIGAIWGNLVLEGEPMSMAQLSKQTGYSLSSISPYLKTLERIGYVRRKKSGGVTLFECVTSLEDCLTTFLNSLLEGEILPLLKNVERAKKELSHLKQTKDTKKMEQVLNKLEREYTRARHLLELKTKMMSEISNIRQEDRAYL